MPQLDKAAHPKHQEKGFFSKSVYCKVNNNTAVNLSGNTFAKEVNFIASLYKIGYFVPL